MKLPGMAVVVVLFWTAASAAADLSPRVWELYSTARYDEALALLDTADESGVHARERQTLREYRLLCLVALGRTDDAARVARLLIEADPFYALTGESRPPRVVALLDDVRRSHLPPLGQQRYIDATTAYNDGRYTDAERLLQSVLQVVQHARGGDAQQEAWLDILESKTQGFLASVRDHLSATRPVAP